MSVLGIDYGQKKVGLAKAGTGQRVATPLKTIFTDSREELLEELKNVCSQESVDVIVVGVPLSLRGSNQIRPQDLKNQHMQDVLSFIEWLKTNFDLPVETEDERLSTKMANGAAKEMVKRYGDDAVAASLILQTYLDKRQ